MEQVKGVAGLSPAVGKQSAEMAPQMEQPIVSLSGWIAHPSPLFAPPASPPGAAPNAAGTVRRESPWGLGVTMEDGGLGSFSGQNCESEAQLCAM